MSRNDKVYEGIYNDKWGGMTAQGQMIRDAWVFGILPETETCQGWNIDRMQTLYDNVSAEWQKYGLLPMNLPPALRERHANIHIAAIQRAKDLGWDAELGDDD